MFFLQGDLPGTCWSFLGQEVSISGREITINVLTRSDPGGCPFEQVHYSFTAKLGRLDPGQYLLTVSDAQNSKSLSFEVGGDATNNIPPYFMRGDGNGDGTVDISDPIALLSALFLGAEPPSCEDAADSNADEELDISDAVYSLSALFVGGSEFPWPGPLACALDLRTIRDSLGDRFLGCESYPPCGPRPPETYRFISNGLDCDTWPCPYWTVTRLADGESLQVSDVDLTALGLVEAELRRELDEGKWNVRGYLLPGPKGPAGIGTTLVMIEIVKPGAAE